MEKIERWIYGFCFLFGGLFLLSFMGYSFTSFNFFEIFSGIGLIFLGIRLFFHKKKLKDEGKKEEILGIVLFIIGLIISLYNGFSIIMMVVSYKPETVLYTLPLLYLPFLMGIILLLYSYSINERKDKAVLPILRGLFALLIFLYILLLIFFTRGSWLSY